MNNSSDRNKVIAKNTIFLYGRMIFVLLVSLYTTRAILNALGVVDFGVYNVVAGFVSMFAFLNTSMSNGIQRFFNYTIGEGENEKLIQVFNTSLQIQAILAFVVFLLLETIGLWYVCNKMVIPHERFVTAIWIYEFSIISLVLVITQIPCNAAIIAHERMGFFALVSIIDAVAKLVIAIALPYIDRDRLFIFGIYSLSVSFANFLLITIYSRKKFKEIRLSFCFNKSLFSSILSFSGWNVFGTFAFMLRAQGITVLLNFFFGTIVNAAQGVAAQIQSAIQGFSGNIIVAFRPQIVQSYAAGDYERVSKMFFSLSKISFLMLFMLSVPVVFEIDYILNLWLGDAIPNYTSYFTILVLAIMVLLSLHTPIVTIIHASGKMRKFQIATGGITCSILPISWIALKMGGEPGSVYWVSLVVLFINQIVCLKILKDIFPYSIKNYIHLVVLPIMIISTLVIISEFGLVIIMNDSFPRLISVCLTSIILTLLVTYFTMTRNEKSLTNQLIINKIRKKWL